jgi:2-oxoglutarate ferredoxin oxidoreductase subunit beta
MKNSFVIKEGVSHRGFAFIEILQNCVSFNKVNTFQWYKSRVDNINEDPAYDPSDRLTAFERAQEWGKRIPIGILFRADRPPLEEQENAIKEMSLVKQRVDPSSFAGILETFR